MGYGRSLLYKQQMLVAISRMVLEFLSGATQQYLDIALLLFLLDTDAQDAVLLHLRWQISLAHPTTCTVTVQ